MMHKPGKNHFARLVPGMLLWLTVSVLLWNWVFNLLTETDPEHKIMLFADMHHFADRALAEMLEEDLPEGIRMVQVHSFDYALMDSASLEAADLYVMTESQVREHQSWLCPLPAALVPSAGALILEGEPVGVPLYNTDEKQNDFDFLSGFLHRSAADFFNFEEAPGETWYLCFGRGGAHLRSLENGVDDAALILSKRLLALE